MTEKKSNEDVVYHFTIIDPYETTPYEKKINKKELPEFLNSWLSPNEILNNDSISKNSYITMYGQKFIAENKESFDAMINYAKSVIEDKEIKEFKNTVKSYYNSYGDPSEDITDESTGKVFILKKGTEDYEFFIKFKNSNEENLGLSNTLILQIESEHNFENKYILVKSLSLNSEINSIPDVIEKEKPTKSATISVEDVVTMYEDSFNEDGKSLSESYCNELIVFGDYKEILQLRDRIIKNNEFLEHNISMSGAYNTKETPMSSYYFEELIKEIKEKNQFKNDISDFKSIVLYSKEINGFINGVCFDNDLLKQMGTIDGNVAYFKIDSINKNELHECKESDVILTHANEFKDLLNEFSIISRKELLDGLKSGNYVVVEKQDYLDFNDFFTGNNNEIIEKYENISNSKRKKKSLKI